MFSSGPRKLAAASLVAGAFALAAVAPSLAQDDHGGWDDGFPGFPPVSTMPMPTVPGWPAGPVWSGDDAMFPDDEGGWDDHGGWNGQDHGPHHDDHGWDD